MEGSESSADPQWGEEVSKEVLERLQRFGSAYDADDAGAAPTGAPRQEPAAANGNGAPPQSERHPEDPPDAVADAGQEVADPERIRIKAARLGMAAQAIGPGYFEALTRPLYDAVHAVRAGAVVMPGQQAAGEKLKIAVATDADVEGIRADGKADANKADWVEQNAVPRAERELKDAEGEVVKARERIESCRRRVEELQEADDREGRAEGTTRIRRRSRQRRTWEGRAGVFGRIAITRERALGIFAAETIGTTLVLTTKVADVFEASLPLAAAIALALSLAILVASYVAAMAAAAVRLPGRVVGLILVAVYAAILFKFIPGLDALRESDSEGVEAMTAATLAACFVAGFTGYLTATREDQREEIEERELKQKAGTPLRHALQDLEEAEDAYTRAQRRVEQFEEALSQLWEKVEQFRDKAARAEVAALERLRTGVEAEAEAAAIEAIVGTGVAQERAAGRWAISIALLAHEKARLEKHPDGNELRIRLMSEAESRSEARSRQVSRLQWVAAGLLGTGGLASLAVGVEPLGFGVSAAVALLVVDRLKPEPEAPSEPEPRPAATEIVPPASDQNQSYRRQPDEMHPKYEDGGARPGERQ